MGTPYKMKGMSFGNSPIEQKESTSNNTGTMRAKMKKTNKETGETIYDDGYSFGEAFADARKSGKKTFTWKSKKYNTKTKEEA